MTDIIFSKPKTEEELLQESLDNLRKQQKELEAKMQETAAKLRAAEKERQENASINVVMYEFTDGGYLSTASDYRSDVVDIMRRIPTRSYVPDKTNVFHAYYVQQLLTELAKAKNVTIEWRDGIREKYESFINRPDYKLTMREKDIKIEFPTNADTFTIARIPGANWNYVGKFYSIPLNEAWRLIDALEGKNKIQMSEDLREFIHKQITTRASLDEIAQKTDSDYDPGFIGDNKLRPFQRVGAEFIDSAGRGIIADQVGLGKTWQALAVAWKNKYKTIIVCPGKLKVNWEREIFRLTGEIPLVLTGIVPSKNDIVKVATFTGHFIIINYEILGRKFEDKEVVKDQEGFDHVKETEHWPWIDLFNAVGIEFAIFDEAHYAKNSSSQRSQASRLLKTPKVALLTATPVLNRPKELGPMLNIIDENAFGVESFTNRYSDGKNGVRNVQELREVLKSRMIRRLKKDVQPDLPDINRMVEYRELSTKARKLYQKVMTGVYELLNEWDPERAGDSKKVTNILTQIMRLKQICSYAMMEETADKAVEIYDSVSDENGNVKWKKVIIYSQFIPAVHGIARRLGNEAIYLTGTDDPLPRDKQRKVDIFQTDPNVHFLVANPQAAGEGLTITAAGTVIWNDQLWTPAGHEQGEGRAYGRLNDAHGIDSVFMMMNDTIMEDIQELLRFKQNTINQTVEGIDAERDTSVAMELIRKLKSGLR